MWNPAPQATKTLSALKNKGPKNVLELREPEGGGGCKFHYELIILSQLSDSNSRGCELSLKARLGNALTLFNAVSQDCKDGGRQENAPHWKLLRMLDWSLAKLWARQPGYEVWGGKQVAHALLFMPENQEGWSVCYQYWGKTCACVNTGTCGQPCH